MVPRVSKASLFQAFLKAVGAAQARPLTDEHPNDASASADSSATEPAVGGAGGCACLGWSYQDWKGAAAAYSSKWRRVRSTELFAKWLASDGTVNSSVACSAHTLS